MPSISVFIHFSSRATRSASRRSSSLRGHPGAAIRIQRTAVAVKCPGDAGTWPNICARKLSPRAGRCAHPHAVKRLPQAGARGVGGAYFVLLSACLCSSVMPVAFPSSVEVNIHGVTRKLRSTFSSPVNFGGNGESGMTSDRMCLSSAYIQILDRHCSRCISIVEVQHSAEPRIGRSLRLPHAQLCCFLITTTPIRSDR